MIKRSMKPKGVKEGEQNGGRSSSFRGYTLSYEELPKSKGSRNNRPVVSVSSRNLGGGPNRLIVLVRSGGRRLRVLVSKLHYITTILKEKK